MKLDDVIVDLCRLESFFIVHLISRADRISAFGLYFAVGVLALNPNCPPTRGPPADCTVPGSGVAPRAVVYGRQTIENLRPSRTDGCFCQIKTPRPRLRRRSLQGRTTGGALLNALMAALGCETAGCKVANQLGDKNPEEKITSKYLAKLLRNGVLKRGRTPRSGNVLIIKIES